MTESLPEPVGDLVTDECEGVMGADGMYFHYTDVCELVSKIINNKIDTDKYKRDITS